MSADGNTPLLQLTEVEAAYGDFQALFNITLTVNRGEIVTLIGGNGAGKTTTLSAACCARRRAPSAWTGRILPKRRRTKS
jgi:branched-chain amino acid transport system ATP-binding protein